LRYEVVLSEDAERDIEDIVRYIAEHDSVRSSERVLAGLEGACARLERFPERGNVPKELRAVGMTEYRETRYKPYRVIYRVAGRQVIIYCVLDGRRDMQSLLERRLLR
jgi:toxin ParE1/3/4